MRPLRILLVTAALPSVTALLLGVTACQGLPATTDQGAGGDMGTGASGHAGNAAAASRELDELTIAKNLSMAGYSRDKFHIWAAQGHSCDTREVVLQRDGTDVVTGDDCKITSGTWVSPYNGKKHTIPRQLDIDHIVPLANAWRSGAKNWTDDKRKQFANDLTRPQLLAVDLTDNRAKGDQGPAEWKPPNHGYWCTYAEDWITVKTYWHLTVTAAEKAALRDMLETCT